MQMQMMHILNAQHAMLVRVLGPLPSGVGGEGGSSAGESDNCGRGVDGSVA